jgi:hypothetical protein
MSSFLSRRRVLTTGAGAAIGLGAIGATATHDVRVDNQFATNTRVPDVVQLQTLQDVVRWSRQGRLLHYKPAGFSKLHTPFRDPQGAWVAVSAIASSYPHDDDAVLYLCSLYVRKYGWDRVAKLAAQDVQFARGSNSPHARATSLSGREAEPAVRRRRPGDAGEAVRRGPLEFT